MAEETEHRMPGVAENFSADEALTEETELPTRPAWREIFRQAFRKAQRDQCITNRRELGRDRSRSLFLLAGAAIAVLLVFLGVFSSSNAPRKPTDAKQPGAPDLGRRVAPGQQGTGQTGSVAPLLSAQMGQSEGQANQDVTPEDVGRTAHPTQQSIGAPRKRTKASVAGQWGPYALGNIDFSDGTTRPQATASSSSAALAVSDDLRKPSLVFVRSVQSDSTSAAARITAAALEPSPAKLPLPAGTKLVARLQSVASSAIKTPVIAAIEYNYEKDGQVVVPAGAKAIGTLQQADASGLVGFRFNTLQMPDGTTEKIEATAMSLSYGPLKGHVSGTRTGSRFLVRTFTGLGTVAAYLVGAGGSNGFNGPLSESALLRNRIATNIGIAGDQELNSLAFNRNIIVTVPGNTRFYLVIDKGVMVREEEAQPAPTEQVNTQLPTAEELRQLMQLRRELSEMYQPSGVQGSAQQASR